LLGKNAKNEPILLRAKNEPFFAAKNEASVAGSSPARVGPAKDGEEMGLF